MSEIGEAIRTAYEMRRQQIPQQLTNGVAAYGYETIRGWELELEQINKRLNPDLIGSYQELIRRGKQP